MLSILGAGSFHPRSTITNEFLENLGIESSAQWIREKIGIEARRSVLPLDYIAETKNSDPTKAIEVAECTPLEMAEHATAEACQRAGISPRHIGLIIGNCCSPNNYLPTISQALASKLGIPALAYDVFTACPAFALHIDYLANFREEQLPDYILCISTGAYTATVDYTNRSDSAIWGDGAAAWIVSPRHEGVMKIRDTFFTADCTRAPAVVIDSLGHFHQDGRAVRDFSVRQTVRLVKALETKYELDWSKDKFIGHQANRTMLEQVTNNRGIPPENHWHNVTFYGNQAGAGAPSVLAEHWGQITPGMRVVIAVVGAGLSWGSVLLEA